MEIDYYIFLLLRCLKSIKIKAMKPNTFNIHIIGNDSVDPDHKIIDPYGLISIRQLIAKHEAENAAKKGRRTGNNYFLIGQRTG